VLVLSPAEGKEYTCPPEGSASINFSRLGREKPGIFRNNVRGGRKKQACQGFLLDQSRAPSKGEEKGRKHFVVVIQAERGRGGKNTGSVARKPHSYCKNERRKRRFSNPIG